MKLFICYTPLHIVLAKKIIQVQNISSFGFIYLYDVETEQNIYYYNLLAPYATYSHQALRRKKIIIDLFIILKIFIETKKLHAASFEIYTANIKSIHTRLLMFLLGYSKLYTFDDGCANIVKFGFYFSPNENQLSKVFFSLFEPKLLYKNLKSTMLIHYTIFHDENIYPNRQYISLFDSNVLNNQKIKKRNITILLTSVLFENNIISLKTERDLYHNVIEYFNVDYVISHPSEKINKIYENNKKITTPYIAEEQIMDFSKTNNITVIGFFSTTLLNIYGLNITNRIISINFNDSHIPNDMVELFLARGIECYMYEEQIFKKVEKSITKQ